MISMRVVKKPRKSYWCAHCERLIDGEHLYLYGGEQFGKPNGIRVCALCALTDSISEVIEFAASKLSQETKDTLIASIARKNQKIAPDDFYCPCGCDGIADHCTYAATCNVCGEKYYGGHGYCDKQHACDDCKAKLGGL